MIYSRIFWLSPNRIDLTEEENISLNKISQEFVI